MKRVLGVFAIVTVAVLLMAQTSSQPWQGTEMQQFLSGCLTHNNDSVVCVATDGVSFSYQGSPFVKVASPTGSITGVTTWNGRTGAVAPIANDYSFSQLSGQPTSLQCSNANISTGASGTLSASGCSFK